MSVGMGPDSPEDSLLDSNFQTPPGHNGVTFVAATGDFGVPAGEPAYSPNVVAVGGTTLTTDTSGNYISETGWSLKSDSFEPAAASGGGVSQYEPRPIYQSTLPYGNRATPDVSFDADPNTGVAIYDSYDSPTDPWLQIGGTSLAAPCWAGLFAIVDQMRAGIGLASLDGPSQTLPMLYSIYNSTRYASDFHDITTGNNGDAAGPGYDLVTGIGSPIASNLANDFLGAKTTTSLSVSAHPTVYGQAVTFTATVSANAPGAGTPTGMVTFLDGTTVLGTVKLSGGAAAWTTTALALGAHTITARYSGDIGFAASDSGIEPARVQMVVSASDAFGVGVDRTGDILIALRATTMWKR
jgi:subtilase family serine protease